jgi:hypothetical protein
MGLASGLGDGIGPRLLLKLSGVNLRDNPASTNTGEACSLFLVLLNQMDHTRE